MDARQLYLNNHGNQQHMRREWSPQWTSQNATPKSQSTLNETPIMWDTRFRQEWIMHKLNELTNLFW